MAVVVATGLGGVGILTAAVAFAGGYAQGEDREVLSMYAGMVLMALVVQALSVMAAAGSFPISLLGPNWLPAFVVPVACVVAAASIAVALLPGMGRPATGAMRWVLVAGCVTCLSLAVLALGI